MTWQKQLSYYLYFFSFSFSFGLTTQEGVWESVMSQVSCNHSHMIGHMMGVGKQCTDHVVVV